MKHKLLVLISTLHWFILFSNANVPIQRQKESNSPQPNSSERPTESTKGESSTSQDEVHDERPLPQVPIQMFHPSQINETSVGQARSADIELTPNKTLQLPNVSLPLSSSHDRMKLIDIINENIKEHFHPPNCSGKQCDELKDINNVYVDEDESNNSTEKNFKHPTIINGKGHSSVPSTHHNSSSSEMPHKSSSTKDGPHPPVSTDEHVLGPYENSKGMEEEPTNNIPLPPEEFPFKLGKEVDHPPIGIHPVSETPSTIFHPKTSSIVWSTAKPTTDRLPLSKTVEYRKHFNDDESSVKDYVIIAMGFCLFGSFCYILHYCYTGRLRSCLRSQRQILLEDFDEEDVGIRIEMNPRNEEEMEVVNESAPL